MNVDALDRKLSETVDNFAREMQFEFNQSKKEFATPDDIDTLSRQTFYALNEMKDAIIEYLKTN